MPHRFVCDVLKEIRKAVEVLRIDMVPGLVEEVQTLVNRMETNLHEYADMDDLGKVRVLRKKLELYKAQVENFEEFLEIKEDPAGDMAEIFEED